MPKFLQLTVKVVTVILFCGSSIALYAQPATPTVGGNLYVCNGSNTTLTAAGSPGATYAWYSAASGGNLLSSSATYTTPALTANTHFYVQQTVSGSTSARYDAYVLVASNPNLSSPTNLLASPSVICQGQSSNLSATVDAAANQYVYWYDSATGGHLLGSSVSGANFTVSPTANKTYYAQSQAQIITQTFNFTGGVQTFTVPAGVTSIQVDASGGRGGYDYECCGTIQGTPGNGGRVQATMNVTPGQVLYIYVGEHGYGYVNTGVHSAYNGGGAGIPSQFMGGGGGATDIRINGQALPNRVLVAGGGGGSGLQTTGGGAGGGLIGGNGVTGQNTGYNLSGGAGTGGTQTAGGIGGNDHNYIGSGSVTYAPNGSLGQGGNAGYDGYGYGWGSGGGGGYYGGGGGIILGTGGGGSSYTDSTLFQNVIHTQGYQGNHGQLTITYNSSANCAATTRQPVVLTVNTTPTVGASPNVITCAGTPVTLTSTGADTYTWAPGNLTGNSVSVSPSSTTTYTVTGKLNNGGCTNTAQVTVTVTSVSASANTAICLNQSTALSASGADSYTWQPGNLSGSSVNVSPSSTTTYTVTGHNNVGCNTTAQTTVTVNPLPVVSIGAGTTVPAGTSVTLTATGADTYSWSAPYSANTASLTFVPAATSTWKVTGYYSATGCSNTATAVVTVTSIPSVSGNTQVCPGNTTSLTASGTGPFTWYTAATGGTLLYTGAAYTTPAITSDTAFYVSDNGSARTPVKIYSVSIPNKPAATQTAICLGATAVLSVNPAIQVNWYDSAIGGNLLYNAAAGAAYNVSPKATKIYYAEVQTQAVAQTFNFTGGVQTFTVPAGVTIIQVDASGGRGGYDYECCGTIQGTPGNGGRVQATMNVTPGQVLYIYVGEHGYGYVNTGVHSAYNGGGAGIPSQFMGGGGGATDIRINGQALTNRVLVAGGGGGSGLQTTGGGAGGGLIGGNGVTGQNTGYNLSGGAGTGGTQTAGGIGGNDHNYIGNGSVTYAPNGSLGQGGNAGYDGYGYGWGSGGGGGYYGGGGGMILGTGGGGSSYTDPTLFQNVVHTQGYQGNHGQLTITYNTSCAIRMPDTVIVNSLPPVKANATPNPVVSGKPVTLTGSGAVSYSWNNGVQNGVAFTPATSNTYTVTGTGANGCTNKDSVLVKVAFTPTITSFSPAWGGAGTTVTIKGTHFTTATMVRFATTAAASFQVLSDSVITAVVGAAGTGVVYVQNPAGLASKGSFTFCSTLTGTAVKVTAKPGLSVCYGTPVTFTATATNGGAAPRYQWYKNNIALADTSSVHVDSLLRGKDSIWVVMTSNRSCVTAIDTSSPKVTIIKALDNVYAYATNQYGSTVSAVNLATGQVMATLQAGSGAATVCFVPATKKVYIANTSDNSVTVINSLTNTVTKTITGFHNPQGIVSKHNGSRVYVINGINPSTVMEIDGQADTVLTGQTINLSTIASGAAITTDGSKIFVTSQQFNKVSVINTATNAWVTDISVGHPWQAAVNTNNSKLYTTNFNDNTVSVIDIATNKVTATIPVGIRPIGVTATPDLTKVYVTNSQENTVSVISTATNTVIATIPVGPGPYGINVTPDGSQVITCNTFLNTLSVISTATNTVVNTIQVGYYPTSFGNFVGDFTTSCPLYTPSVTIDADRTSPVCTKTKVTFTATPLNAGLPLTYAWYKSKVKVGINAAVYVDSTLKNNDSVWCVITSGADNLTKNTATSNVLKYVVNALQTSTIKVTASPSTGTCTGTPVTFTATTTNAGASPGYQWQKNNINVGTNSAAYTDNGLANGDSIRCILTPSVACAATLTVTSPQIKAAVTSAVPGTPGVITGLTTVTANQAGINYSITGNANLTYTWAVPAGATITAGQGTQKITVTWGNSSGIVSVKAGNICGLSAARQLTVNISGSLIAQPVTSSAKANNDNLRVYPNPVVSIVTLEFSAATESKYEAQLVNSLGQVITSKAGLTIKGANVVSFDVSRFASAMYYIRLVDTEHGTRMMKFTKAK